MIRIEPQFCRYSNSCCIKSSYDLVSRTASGASFHSNESSLGQDNNIYMAGLNTLILNISLCCLFLCKIPGPDFILTHSEINEQDRE